MERALGLIAGAGALPGWAAAQATRQGWQVVAFAFEDAAGLDQYCKAVIPSRIDQIQNVLDELCTRRVSAAVFAGKFWKHRVFAHQDRDVDAAALHLVQDGLSDGALAHMVVATLGSLGIEVLDQRQFLSPWILASGTLTERAPTDAEWTEIREGFRVARRLAEFGIGQTVVRSIGVTVAVEAIEGTDETIRRGTRLSGRGAVVVKAVASTHDYRFDVPAIGPDTLEAMTEGGATALAVQAGTTLLAYREDVVRLADRAGIAMVSVDEQL